MCRGKPADCVAVGDDAAKPMLTVSPNLFIKENNTMLKGLIGKKIGMTQIFDESGAAVPVTLIETGPCFVVQIRTKEVEGYSAVQLGFGEVKPKRLTGGQLGHLKKNNIAPVRYLREFRVKEAGVVEGEEIKVDKVFAKGAHVDVIGTSKGKGFAGTVKRHNFMTSRHTHGGQGDVRKIGSIGSMYPQHVFKGKRMAGRMGHDRVTVKNLVVTYIDAENNLIGLRGAVPGPKKGLVIIGGKS